VPESTLDSASGKGASGKGSVVEPLLTTLMHLTDDGVLLVDGRDGVSSANTVAATMLGRTSTDQLIGRSLPDLLDTVQPRDAHDAPLLGSEAWSLGQTPPGVHLRLRPRRGPERAIRLTSARAIDGGHVVLMRDLTPLRAAEDRGLQYRQAIESSLDGIFLAGGEDLRIRYANPAAARQSGWPREALVGRPLSELMPRLDAPSVEGVVAWEATSESPVTTVLRVRGGQLKPVDTVVHPIDDHVDGAMVMAIVRDAAERIEAQVRLQRLVQQERIRAGELEATLAGIGDAVIVMDATGRVVLTNPATREVFPGRRIDRHEDLLAVFDDADGEAPRLDRHERQGPVELRWADRDRWVELTAFPIVAADELSGGMIVLARDATLARDARRIRETFLGILSHELRTPITTILGGVKVLRRHEEDAFPLRRELHEDIEAEAERLYRLVEDLLVLARFEDDRVEPMTDEPLLLRRLMPSLLASEEARWPGRRFDVVLPAGLSVVQGDRTYLEQILRNLLGNAAKYSSPEQPIEIRVEPDSDEVHVLVLDRGPGLEPDEAERLFDLYYRSPRTGGMAGGAGIGLFVCRVLVEAMGGRIWARPREGGGAEFGFALKVLEEEIE
jgi:PAS domain S-box-containing protein